MRYRQSINSDEVATALITPSVFVPVVQVKMAAVTRQWRIGAQLPNGVKFDLCELMPD